MLRKIVNWVVQYRGPMTREAIWQVAFIESGKIMLARLLERCEREDRDPTTAQLGKVWGRAAEIADVAVVRHGPDGVPSGDQQP